MYVMSHPIDSLRRNRYVSRRMPGTHWTRTDYVPVIYSITTMTGGHSTVRVALSDRRLISRLICPLWLSGMARYAIGSAAITVMS